MADKGIITVSEKQADEIKKNNKLLIKVILISTAIAFVLGVCIVVWNSVGWNISMKELTFDNYDDFKEFIENDYETWYKEGFSYLDENGDMVAHIPLSPEDVIIYPPNNENNYYPKKIYKEIKNSKGEVIFDYYYNPDLYEVILFTESADDKMPVTVITNQAHYDARNTYQTVESMLYMLIAIDFIVATGVYLIIIKKQKKTVQ